MSFNWRVMYNDGSVEDDPKKYKDLKREDVKSVTILKNSVPIDTLNVKDNKFLIRRRTVAKGMIPSFDGSKICWITATNGEQHFVWEDGKIEKKKNWGKKEPYTKPILRTEENVS